MCSFIMNHTPQPSRVAGLIGLRLTAPRLAQGNPGFSSRLTSTLAVTRIWHRGRDHELVPT